MAQISSYGFLPLSIWTRNFRLGQSPWGDDFAFAYPVGSNVCFDVSSGVSNVVTVGEAGLKLSAPFNPETLGPCGPDSASLYIDNVSIDEDAYSGELTVTLTPSSSINVNVDYIVADDTAIAGIDYTATSGSLEFLPGEATKSIPFSVFDDLDVDGNKAFSISLDNAVGADIVTSVGTVTILDNESQPACGMPAYDPAADSEMFLWRDCTTGLWSVRVTASSGFRVYSGSLTADTAFSSVAGVSLESSDELSTSGDLKTIDYTLKLAPPWWDGIDFSVPDGATVCYGLDIPVSTVLVGVSRIPAEAPFDLLTLDPC
jgi:hypothetical protein